MLKIRYLNILLLRTVPFSIWIVNTYIIFSIYSNGTYLLEKFSITESLFVVLVTSSVHSTLKNKNVNPKKWKHAFGCTIKLNRHTTHIFLSGKIVSTHTAHIHLSVKIVCTPTAHIYLSEQIVSTDTAHIYLSGKFVSTHTLRIHLSGKIVPPGHKVIFSPHY